jgi:PLP dependent protein
MTDIGENYQRMRERVAQVARQAGRDPEEITLLPVSKTMSVEKVREVIAVGGMAFGENYVQEAREKIPAIKTLTLGTTWHFIGHLQTNKVKYVVPLFDWVQSVDRLSLATELNKQAGRCSKTMRVLVEVKLQEDSSPEGEARSGVSFAAAEAFCGEVANLPHLKLCGLMGMAPAPIGVSFGESPEDARPYFRRLRGLWDSLPPENRVVLSMGMSGDFEVAIEEGSTLVRVGTAIFGRRF